ncbi:MAG: SGNH/GDSL hydrolase family protein [Clostridiales bacterium]|nr:SGNH/GDSL hydrolase family protein [Candidatus Blautia equi]
MSSKKVLCLGDSLTDCGRLFSEDPLGDGYVSLLHASLKENGREYTFINRGVDGFTVSRLCDNARSHYLSLKPDRITILIGINDIGIMMNTNRTETQREALMKDFFSHYEQLLCTLRIATKDILLMEPFVFPYPLEFSLWEPYQKQMSLGIRALADAYRLPFLPLQEVLTASAAESGYSAITTDGVHLTRMGHAILAEQLNSFFTSDL